MTGQDRRFDGCGIPEPHGAVQGTRHETFAVRAESHGPHAVLVSPEDEPGTKFVPSETGGSCSPGCHANQAYDRTLPDLSELEEK